MSDVSGTIRSVTEGGIAADHIEVPLPPAIVAATHSGQEQNTLRQSIIPFACWRADDMRFDFESSFVKPEIATEIGLVKDLIDAHTVTDGTGTKHQPALSIFGHADPTGNDDFNKALSGRRAQAIYGLLTRKTDLWEDLFSHSFGGDKWGRAALGTMLDTVSPAATESDPAAGQERKKKIDQLEHDAGQRKALFRSYMDALCAVEVFRLETADQAQLQSQGVKGATRLTALLGQEFREEGDFMEATRNAATAGELVQHEDALLRSARKKKPFEVKPEDFLARGADRGGKGDFQGCGEFNPVFLQSQKDFDRFEQVPASSPEKPILKAVRDAANEPDRRVLIFLFRPGIHISPDVWPCPRVKEGVEGCKKRFWSDGEKRRSVRLPDEPRTFEETKDTFACRFYHRLVEKSPCEKIVKSFEVRLYSPIGRAIPLAPCAISIGKRKPFPEKANARGIITLRDVEVPAACNIRWGFPQDEGREPELIFSLDLFLKSDEPLESNRAEEGKRKLNNLGYTKPEPTENVRSFQLDYGHLASPPLDVTGNIDDRTLKVLREVYQQSADDLRNTPVN